MPKTLMSELRSCRSMLTIGASSETLEARLKNENEPLTWRSYLSAISRATGSGCSSRRL